MKIEQCPYCQNKETAVSYSSGFFVVCNHCHARGRTERDATSAIISWNTVAKAARAMKLMSSWVNNVILGNATDGQRCWWMCKIQGRGAWGWEPADAVIAAHRVANSIQRHTVIPMIDKVIHKQPGYEIRCKVPAKKQR